ncbi:AAA family ATPase [Shewanella olleyana]|uniref:AAA family ATPase n=1 Tax=Shewanella olleyana TaxID=135626 RepID=UPI0020100E8A|nr:AAA family ATPase [Shewanella olleyana]MCL1067570.1 AAA family ATPase [Shewanella olleyana]
MDIQQTLLLPSQESLVQRLEHIASYSEQLVLVSGSKGSGKTTLVTALASELDNYNSALVICPMHAESAEIRRKILVQLISSPIFDDALPLADTLLRIQSSLTKPLHIIIDDAQYMSRELWAECLVLTQLKCAGKPISITFTVEPDSFADLSYELTETMQSLLLHVEVEPLSLAEREGLYRTLLIRSNRTPFIPREIIQAQIEKQSGTPAEVIELLKKALEDEPVVAKKWTNNLTSIVPLGLILLIGLFVVGFYFYQSEQQAEIERDKNSEMVDFLPFTAPVNAPQWFIFDYGKSLIARVFTDTSSQVITHQISLDNDTSVDTLLIISPVSADDITQQLTAEDTVNLVDEIAEMDKAEDVNLVDNQNVQLSDVAEEQTIVERDKLEIIKDDDDKVAHTDKLTDRAGYTLQIASVREEKSLKNILTKLEIHQSSAAELVQAKYKNRHIVLFGQFESTEQALQESETLQQQLGLSAPWIRKWSDLKGYEIKSN